MRLNKLKINKETERLIRLQRTSLGEDISEEYLTSLRQDYDSIKDYIGEPKKVLDIGCGIGGIGLFLDNLAEEFYLFDKTGENKDLYYGYKPEGCFYNSLELAEKFLRDNGFKSNLTLLDLSEGQNISNLKDIDLVISLISWGFHYPVKTYLKQVDNLLSENGKIIIDLRKLAFDENLKEFIDLGYTYQVIKEYQKHYRVLLTKSKDL